MKTNNPEDNQLENKDWREGLLMQCLSCNTFGHPFPDDKVCGNCGKDTDTVLYVRKSVVDKQAEKQREEMVKRVERIKLDMDVIICDCGEPYSESDAADLVNELFEDLTNNKDE